MSRLLWYPGHELLLPEIDHAKNCHLYDVQGHRYVDLESGVWCTSIGHGNPAILRTIAEQSGRIAHAGFNYSSSIVEETAAEFLSLLGFTGGKCVFLCSGSEAVEYGVRVAQMVAPRPLLLTMADSYFGAYGSASTKRETEWYHFDWSQCADCPDSDDCDEGCEHQDAIPYDRIGGFVFEPGSSSGLVRFPPRKLVDRIVTAVVENDGLVMVNEVTTGIGRTGSWFGFQHYGVSPDIVALGKAIGNGYPVSVTAFAPRVIEQLGGEPVPYAQSHQNDPLGAAVAREVLRIIKADNLVERGREIATVLLDGLQAIQVCSDRIVDLRARGLMVALELKDDADASFTTRAHRELVRRGFVVGRRPGLNVLRLDLSLTIDREDIEGFLATLEEILAAEDD